MDTLRRLVAADVAGFGSKNGKGCAPKKGGGQRKGKGQKKTRADPIEEAVPGFWDNVIERVRNQPIVWNHRLAEYKKTTNRDRAWQAIYAGIMDDFKEQIPILKVFKIEDPTSIKKRFWSKRDYYRDTKFEYELATRSGQGGELAKSIQDRLDMRLQFLDEVLRPGSKAKSSYESMPPPKPATPFGVFSPEDGDQDLGDLPGLDVDPCFEDVGAVRVTGTGDIAEFTAAASTSKTSDPQRPSLSGTAGPAKVRRTNRRTREEVNSEKEKEMARAFFDALEEKGGMAGGMSGSAKCKCNSELTYIDQFYDTMRKKHNLLPEPFKTEFLMKHFMGENGPFTQLMNIALLPPTPPPAAPAAQTAAKQQAEGILDGIL